jgi:competence protein ComEC
MVVSGGHLQLLAFLLLLPAPKFVRRNPIFRFLLWVALLAYCLFTGFQAPVVRAFVARAMASVNYYFRWNWDLGKIQVAAGLLCLMLFPEWLQSFSFFLSWLASMGFLLAPLCFPYRSRKARASFWQMLLTSGLIQAFVAIVFGSFSVLAVLMNALLAAPLAFLIVVISLAPLLSIYLIPVSDRIWDWLLIALEKTLPWAPPAANAGFSSRNWMLLWSFLILLQAILHLIYQQRYRASHV